MLLLLLLLLLLFMLCRLCCLCRLLQCFMSEGVLLTCLCCLCNKLARHTLKTPKAAYRTLRKAVGTKQGVAGLTPRPFSLEEEAGTHHGMCMLVMQ